MAKRQRAPVQPNHSVAIRQAYARVLAGTSVGSRYVELEAGNRVHLLEMAGGPPVVFLHGTVDSAGFFLPLLNELDGVRALAPDLPGRGLSDPVDFPRHRYREFAVAWLDGLLDALELNIVALVGHSGGGRWALWYALAHPGRVNRLVLIGVPGLHNTRCPLPIRLIATPGLGELLSRWVPPSRTSVLRFAAFMGEKAALATHPELVDLMVATGRDSIARPAPGQRCASWFRRLPCCRVLGSGASHPCVPTSCTSWPCPRWWYGANTTPWRRFGRPGSNRPHPARAIGDAAHRACTMAGTPSADRRSDSRTHTVTRPKPANIPACAAAVGASATGSVGGHGKLPSDGHVTARWRS